MDDVDKDMVSLFFCQIFHLNNILEKGLTFYDDIVMK